MKAHFLFAGIVLILAACGTQQPVTQNPYTDATVLTERKAYIRCAVTKAFSLSDTAEPALDIAQVAVRECDLEKIAVFHKLSAENAGKPDGRSYAAYVNELHTTMVSHIAVKLMEARTRKRASERTDGRAMHSDKI